MSATEPPTIPETLRGHYAGFVSRTIALVLDLIIILVVQTLVAVSIQVITQFLGLSSLPGVFINNRQTVVEEFSQVVRWFVAFLSSAFVFSSYCVILWVLIDKTVGQALLGVRVVRTNGQRLTFVPAIKRVIGYYISALILFLGFLWVLVDDRRQGWHDKIADTVVVYDWDARLGRQMRAWLAGRRAQTPIDEATTRPPPENESPVTTPMKEG